MTQITWPHQSEAIAFYGDPRAGDHANIHWEAANLVHVDVPFHMTYEDGKLLTPVPRITIHHKAAESLARVLADIRDEYLALAHEKLGALSADAAGEQALIAKAQALMEADRITRYSGSYCYRAMRGGKSLSMHAYGCAIDFDAEDNPMGHPGRIHVDSLIVKAFEREGWTWGGRWTRPDPMHFQACYV